MTLAAALGASQLVFGSPRNRRRGTLGTGSADRIAVELFRRLGRAAVTNGVTLCIEPNPSAYGCDFVTNAAEGIAFVERVNCEGIGLHLDTGAMTLAGEDPSQIIPAAGRWLRHFHISEPFLRPIGSGSVDHAAFSDALARARFGGWLSIEMRATDDDTALDTLRRAVAYARKAYAGLGGA
jgi:D-psicose/D-tagatose/L-ribulose 3-epimerase